LSPDLHEAFWRWREQAPERPYWAHFQTTDVHAVGNRDDFRTVSPFAGLFVGPAEWQTRRGWQDRLRDAMAADTQGQYVGQQRLFSDDFEKAGVSRAAFFAILEGLYGEAMAHNDYQLGRLIDRLKAAGEWERTLLIVTADHSVQSAQLDLSLAQLETLPPLWSEAPRGRAGPMFRNSNTRVPLIVVWPGHIKGGQRFEAPVSLIDLLPTALDLTGLLSPEVMQGQSLAPLLRGEPGWTPRPVILDEFETDARGQVRGRLDVVDGRWGASMWIGPPPAAPYPPRPTPVLVYDLWNDPICVNPINEQRPDLVEKYTTFLEDTWNDHRALATQFTPGAKVALTPEQLERLRALGYIR
jgi:arylsulfatase A-like enzyme